MSLEKLRYRKQCKLCTTKFEVRSAHERGMRLYCDQCKPKVIAEHMKKQREYYRLRRIQNPKLIHDKDRKYREKNREKIRQQARDYQRKNREHLNAMKRTNRFRVLTLADRIKITRYEKALARHRAWYHRNKEAISIKNKARYQERKNPTRPLPYSKKCMDCDAIIRLPNMQALHKQKRCKDCITIQTKIRYLLNRHALMRRQRERRANPETREHNRMIQKRYKEKNRDKIIKRRRELRLKNRDKINARQRERWAANLEKNRAQRREYYHKNKERMRAYKNKYDRQKREKRHARV